MHVALVCKQKPFKDALLWSMHARTGYALNIKLTWTRAKGSWETTAMLSWLTANKIKTGLRHEQKGKEDYWLFLAPSVLNSFSTMPIGHRSHVNNDFRVASKFKFVAMRHIVPSCEWLGNCSSGSGTSPCYLTGWQNIRNEIFNTTQLWHFSSTMSC